MIFRALLDALDNWVSKAITPPENQIPTNSKGTLVDFKYWKSQFPKIPNLVTPQAPNKLSIYDYGPKATSVFLILFHHGKFKIVATL